MVDEHAGQNNGQQMSMEQLLVGLHNHVGILTEVLIEKGVLSQEDLMKKAKDMQEKAATKQAEAGSGSLEEAAGAEEKKE